MALGLSGLHWLCDFQQAACALRQLPAPVGLDFPRWMVICLPIPLPLEPGIYLGKTLLWGFSCIPEARPVVSCPEGTSPGLTLTQVQPLRDRERLDWSGGARVGVPLPPHTHNMGPGPW